MRKKHSFLFPCLLVIAAGIICYFNSLRGEFVWDDFWLVRGNSSLKSFGSIGKIFTSELSSGFDYYRPLQAFSYLIDYRFSGFNPFGYHLSNVILHILNGLIVFAIFKKLLKNPAVSLLGALLFICAPFYTEAVAYISSRADLLLGLFILSAFLSYIKERYILSLFFFILALFSKEQAIAFPFILIIYEFCFKKWQKDKLQYHVLFFLTNIWYIVSRLTVFNFSHQHILYRKIYFSPAIGLFPRLLTFFKSIVLYLKIIFLPLDLHMERKISAVKDLRDPYAWIFLAGVVLLIYWLIKIRDRHLFFREFKKPENRCLSLILFGVIWFFVMLLPQSAFVFPLIMAEHFLYLPSVGLFLACAVLARKRRIIFIFASLWVLFYSFLTVAHNINWRDPVAFYKWTLKLSPSSTKIHYMLGINYAESGLMDLALTEFKEAIGKDENFFLSKLGMEYLEKVYQGKKDFLSTLHHNIGAILSQKGLLVEAEVEFKAAIKLNPRLKEAYNDLGCLYDRQGRLKEAMGVFEQALEIAPDFAQAYYNLGVVYAQQNDFKKARFFWKKALKLEPNYALAEKSLKEIGNER